MRWLRVLLIPFLALGQGRGEVPLRLGVLAVRPQAQAEAQWRPLAAYLEGALGQPVALTLGGFQELDAAAAAGQLDVVLTNPGHHILLRHRVGLSAPLATQVTLAGGHRLTHYGSVIFTRAEAGGIASLADLAGRRIAITSVESQGSYHLPAFELVKAGVALPAGEQLQVTGMPHDRVVEAVLAGRADAGFARTGILEAMAREGKLDLARIRVLHRQAPPGFPFLVSTPLYPEWPVAVLPHVDVHRASRIAVALLSLPSGHPAALAAGVDGFRVPEDYDPIEGVLRGIRQPPFDREPEITLAALWYRYRGWITALAVLLSALAVLALRLGVQNRRLRLAREESDRQGRRLAEVIRGTHAGTWEWNVQTGEMVVNDRWAEMLGHRLEDLLPVVADTWNRLAHPEDLARSEEALQACFRGERETYEAEVRMRHRDGSWVWVLDRGRVVEWTGDGRPLRMSGTHQDVTGQKTAALRLAASEEMLRTVADFALDWEYWQGPDREVLHMSPSTARLTGRPPEAFREDPGLLLEIVHPGDRARFEAHLQEEWEQEEGALDLRILRPDGSVRWIAHVCHGVRGADGQPKGRRVSCRDITERKRAEEELQRVNRALHAISACDRAVTHALDEGGLLREVCGLIVALGGYRMAWVGLAGTDPARTVTPVAQAGFEEGYLETLHITWGDDARGQGPTGTAIRTGRPSAARDILTDPCYEPWRAEAVKRGYASSLVLPLSAERQVFGALNIYSDHADAFDTQEVVLLARLAESVAFGVTSLRSREARQQALSERQALEAQLQHLQRMEGIGRLAGGIAHDMNNVLAAVMAVASLIQRRGGEDGHRAGMILDASRRGRDLVKGLMEFARKEVQEAELLDLNQLVSKEAELLASTTLGRIRIELDLEPGLPRLMGAGAALGTALMNLCVNAIDAMPEGGVLLLRTASQGLREVLLEVADTGTGMPPEVAARAMEPFFTTKPVGKGTGLGLSVVFGTVQAHGGSIDIDSRPGRGTRVRIRLPLVAAERAWPAEPLPAALDPAFPALRLLLVDDDPLVRHAAESLLQGLGHEVEVAEGGGEALHLLADGRSRDAVLLDLNMPGVDGVETLRRLRAFDGTTPVLVVSGYADAAARARLAELGPVAVLPKPYGAEEVQRALLALVDGAVPRPVGGP